ncbi:hypothetical protein [Bosea sp. (in: a-proteobacteria)]|uniref:hypothetical protein n=1 Tax=Bosea sp. (in: a-proteobacteria) TaxID=1871050 RepID=UPI002FC6FC72
MQTLFGFELSTGLRWIIAFAIVLLLVALFAFFLRRITGGRLKFKGQGSGRTRQPRLGVVDIHDLDRQRQLILVRRDNVEHLVMIGGASDVVIETNIMRSGARVAAPLPNEGAPERPLALEPLALPELPLRGEIPDEPRRMPPAPEPVPPAPAPVMPPPPPRQQPLAPPARPTGQPIPPARPAPQPAVPPAAAAAVAASAAAAQSARETVAAGQAELGDMARQLEEALKRPFSAVRPSSVGARPEPEAVKPPVAPVPPVSPVVPPVPTGALKPPAPAAGVPVSSRPALDMEAELEMALGLKPGPARPAEAPMVVPPVFAAPERKPQPVPARPEPGKPEPARAEAPRPPADNKPEPAAKPHEISVPSVEAVLGVEPKQDGPKTSEARTSEAKTSESKPSEAKGADPRPSEPKPSEPKPAETKGAEPKAAEPSADPKPGEAKAEKPKAEQSVEAKPPEAKPSEPKPAEADPFSVDAIEAEFARLLGRDPKPKG